MPIELGFDLYPPLSSDVEQAQWQHFLQDVRREYRRADYLTELSDGGLQFEVGNHPLLPYAGRHFRRFGSQLLRADSELTSELVLHLGDIAREHFESRIHYWRDDLMDEIYTHEEVQTAAAAARRASVVTGSSELGQRHGADSAVASGPTASRKRLRVEQAEGAGAASSGARAAATAASSAGAAGAAAAVAAETQPVKTEECDCDIRMWREQALTQKRRADQLEEQLADTQQDLLRVNAQVSQLMQQLRTRP